ncbi:MAG TPA: hypothetical protein VKA21_17025 [Candidatus Binatia bacterium]|nr:hypothetical protein [Candidatus Binatia bacterium]
MTPPSARTLLPRAVAYVVLLAALIMVPRGETLSYGPELAAAIAAAVRRLGLEATAAGDVVTGYGFSMRIAPVCDGWDLSLLLGLAILLSPAPARARLVGAAVAVAVTQLLNLGRLVSMFLVGVYVPHLFDLLHHLVWQAAAIVIAVVLYGAWLRRATAVPHAR